MLTHLFHPHDSLKNIVEHENEVVKFALFLAFIQHFILINFYLMKYFLSATRNDMSLLPKIILMSGINELSKLTSSRFLFIHIVSVVILPNSYF